MRERERNKEGRRERERENDILREKMREEKKERGIKYFLDN